MRKVDVFNHILPPKYTDALTNKSVHVAHHPELLDISVRLRILDRFNDYVQILNIAEPPIEDVADANDAIDLAKIANDEMAELVRKYPDKFIAAVACLPMNNMDAAMKELDRAILDLNFKGVQISSNIMDKSLASPEFEPLFEKMSYYNLPILIHPRHMRSGPRALIFPDGWLTGPRLQMIELLADRPYAWPYETTIAMGCLVFSGILDKYPNLKIITHHCGGLVPYQIGRVSRYTTNRQRTVVGFSKSIVDYYKMMYGDTALWGNTIGLMCGYEFFGADHILFGTDMPFGSQGGDEYIRKTIDSISEINIPAEDKEKIYERNAVQLFDLV